MVLPVYRSSVPVPHSASLCDLRTASASLLPGALCSASAGHAPKVTNEIFNCHWGSAAGTGHSRSLPRIRYPAIRLRCYCKPVRFGPRPDFQGAPEKRTANH